MRPTAPMFPRSTRRSSILSRPSRERSERLIKFATVVLGSVEVQLFPVKIPCFKLAMDRYVLTDAQWAKMEPHCRGKKSDPGRSGADNRQWLLLGSGVV